MSHLPAGLACLFAALAAGGCYEDASTAPRGVPVTVRLADGSSPVAHVERVEVYVAEVAASTTADTLPDEQGWRVIATPRQRFDLVAVRAGSAILAAEGFLPPDVYQAVRLTLDTDSSRVRLKSGADARVRWPVSGEYLVHAIVEQPLVVPTAGGLELVLNVQMVQSLSVNLDPLFDLVFFPVVRAVDRTATGGVGGVVSADDDGDGVGAPLADAFVTIYRGDPAAPVLDWRVVTAARSDRDGAYRIGFLLAGIYIVRVEGPLSLPPVAFPDLLIVPGGESRLDVTLGAAALSTGRAPLVSVPRAGRRR